MPISFTPDLSVSFILERVSEEEIFERYGNGLKVQTGMFCSTLRSDRRPTCRFYRSSRGKLLLHDFSGNFHGDCIDLVRRVKGLDYHEALRDIAKTFGIISGTPRHPVISGITIGPKVLCDLRIKSLPWDAQHMDYWDEYGITSETLEKFDVVPVERVWLNSFLYYNRDFTRKTEVVFAYRFGSLDYKVYFPMRKERRFLHNNPDILQGYTELPLYGDVVVITKAMKDVMCLYEFGIPAIAPMSETSVVTDSVLADLQSRFKKVVSLYDRDRVGYIASLSYRKRGIKPLMMPRKPGDISMMSKGVTKDFSDLCKLDYGKAKELANKFKLIYWK
jgi:hypothetical protein